MEVVSAPPGVRAVRETNLCRVSVHADERTGRLIVFSVIDNLWKGTASQAVQNLNLMFGRPEGEGITLSPFFASRWVPCPDHVTELGGEGLPAGFRAAGVAAGIKDVGLPRRRGDRLRRAGGHERRALHRLGDPGAAGAALPRARPAGRAARSGGQLGQRQRRHRPGRL